ncbi:MAG: class I adenylate-forming enzyme family protein [Acidimicrobiales bacterium]
MADENASRPVTIDSNGSRSTREILDLADGIAEDLRPGERLAVVADEHAVALASLLATAKVRGSVALVSPYQQEVDAMIARFGPSALVAPPSQPGPTSGGEGAGEIVSRRTVPIRRGDEEDLALTALRPRRPLDPSAAPLVVLFTSGTVGTPKMVAHSESSVLAAYRLVRAVWFEMLAPELLSSVDEGLDGPGLGPWFGEEASLGVAMTYLTGMPVASVAGFSLAMQALLSGGCIVDRPRYTPDAIVDAVASLRVTSLGVAPITAQMLVRGAVYRHTDTSSLIVVGMGGSGVPPGLHRSIEETFGCRVVSGYGATELGGVVATTRYTDAEEDRWTSLGRPVPGVRLRVDDGELLVQSPSLAAGYLSEDGQVAPLIDSSGWYRTGDEVSMLEGGRYRFEGRRSGVIVRGGRKIDPETVEAVLLEHPGVRHAAVIGAPSRVAGEEDVVAYVSVTSAVRPSELRRQCIDRLGPGMSPRRVQVLDALPMDTLGRVDRCQLRRSVIAETVGSPRGTTMHKETT